MKITFLGGGNMASALIGGLVKQGFDATGVQVVGCASGDCAYGIGNRLIAERHRTPRAQTRSSVKRLQVVSEFGSQGCCPPRAPQGTRTLEAALQTLREQSRREAQREQS